MKLLSKVVALAGALCLLSIGSAALAALPDVGVSVAPVAPVTIDDCAATTPTAMFVEVTNIADCDQALLAETGLCAAPTTRNRMVVLITTTATPAELCGPTPHRGSQAPPG